MPNAAPVPCAPRRAAPRESWSTATSPVFSATMSQNPFIVNCPTCGAAMTLDDAYLAQYAGQTTTCPNCRQPFTIPAPGVQSPGVISYANPYASAGVLFDDGVGLVMQKNAVGPDRCVKCNEPAK